MLELLQPGMLEAFGLILLRTSAVVVSAPVLGFGTGFSGYKVGLIVALSMLLYFAVGEPLPVSATWIELGAFAVRELFIGFFLGFLLHLVMLAVRVGGELIGHEMGFMVGRQVDPATGVSTPLVTSVYENLFLLAVLSLNGHHWLMRSLGESIERAPVGSLELGAGIAPALQQMFGEMFRSGIVFAGPVMVFLVLVSMLMGLLARAVPNLNVLEIGFTIRVLVAMVGMYLFSPLLEPAMTGLHASFVHWLDHGLTLLES